MRLAGKFPWIAFHGFAVRTPRIRAHISGALTQPTPEIVKLWRACAVRRLLSASGSLSVTHRIRRTQVIADVWEALQRAANYIWLHTDPPPPPPPSRLAGVDKTAPLRTSGAWNDDYWSIHLHQCLALLTPTIVSNSTRRGTTLHSWRSENLQITIHVLYAEWSLPWILQINNALID